MAIILEQVFAQNDLILEFIAGMSGMPSDVKHLKEDMIEVKADIKVIKAVVTDQSKELRSHHRRITTLEAAS